MTLTITELADKYNLTENTISKNFPKIKEKLEKKHGITIEKIGRGQSAQYVITDFEHSDPNRAVTLYKSMEKNKIPSVIAAGLLDLNFLIFIGIVSSPQRVFRGSYADLLKYLELPIKAETLAAAKASLKELTAQSYIMYGEDPTDNNYFMAGVLRKTETEMTLEIQAVLHFKKLLEDTRKSWIPVMKVYLALHCVNQPCTLATLEYVTGLTKYKVRDCLKLLEKSNVIKRELKYLCSDIEDDFICLGSEIDINAFGIPDAEM